MVWIEIDNEAWALQEIMEALWDKKAHRIS